MAEPRLIRSFDGTTLWTEHAGQGPAVVLCDGLGCDGFIWKYLWPALVPRYHVIHLHYRGHGQSGAPKHPSAVGIASLRADLVAVLDAYGIERAVLLGHSMGAQVVFDFALTYPDRIGGVVSLCGSYGRPLDSLRGTKAIGRLFPVLTATLRKFPEAGERLWQWFFQHDLSFAYARRFEANERAIEPADFRPYFTHLSQMDPHVFVSLVARIQEHSVLERLHELRVPALLVAGEKDTFCPSSLSTAMYDRMARARLVIVPNGSHVAPLENQELVGQAVDAFLHEVTR